MKVKFQGFELRILAGNLNWPIFLSHLESISGVEITFMPFQRVLCLDSSKDAKFALGLYVSIKDIKRFCEIRTKKGSFELSAHDLQQGARYADFNFFIIHKQTLRGIYQYYHQSCSLNQFLTFIKSQFYDCRDKLVKDLRDQKGKLPAPKRLEMLEGLHQAELSAQVLMKQDAFEDLLDQFSTVKQIKFEIATYDANQAYFAPLLHVSKKRTERVLFKKNITSRIKAAVKNFIGSDAVENIRVKGDLENGLEKTLSLSQNMEDFGSFDYNDITKHLKVELAKFSDSKILEMLLDSAKENRALIGN